jgi:hypothetical protein
MGWGFTFTAGLARTKNGPSPFTLPAGSTTRRCGHWRRRPPNAQPMPLTPGTIARILTSPKSNASFFNVLLFLGSLPEEYEPDQVLRAAREKKGHLRPELRAAPLPGQGGLPAGIPSDRSGAPTHRAQIAGPLASRPLAPANLRGREPAAKADLDPTLQNDRPRRLT